MKPHKIIHKYYVSKRDTHRRLGNAAFIYVFLTLFVAIVFSLQAKADDRSKTEADGGCIDCALQSLKLIVGPEGQMKDFKAINTAIFSSDPSGQTFIDPREKMDRSDSNSQLNAIGLVVVNGTSTSDQKITESGHDVEIKSGAKLTGTGTGFLINDCLVLTNQHVSSLENNANKLKNLSISFTVGAPTNGNSKFLLQSAGKVVDQGNFSGGDDINQDWAIIKLDKPLGKTVGSIPVITDGTVELAQQLPVSSASFYTDKTDGSQLWGQKKCSLFRSPVHDDQMITDCAAIPGASGSPIFVQDPNSKKIYAVGLIQGGHTNKKLTSPVNDHNANSMVPLFKAFSKAHLDELKKKYQCDAIST